MKRMPPELKAIRKQRIGRHRVYYTGSHHDCKYNVVHIKSFKKYGTDDDDDKAFQRYLASVLITDKKAKDEIVERPKD